MVIVIEAVDRAQFLRLLADLSGFAMEPQMKDVFLRGWFGDTVEIPRHRPVIEARAA